MGGHLPPREKGLWFLGWVQRGRAFVVDFLCGAVPRDMDRQVRWVRDHLEHGPQRLKVFQVDLVELLQARYRDRGSRLRKLKEAVSSPEHGYLRQVHAFLTPSRGEQVSPLEVRQPVYHPPVVSLFGGLPLDFSDAIYADILRLDLVGARLLRWEADMVFPLWLSAWARWHATFPPLLSGGYDSDLRAHLLRVDSRAFAFCPFTQVEDEQQGSRRWHEDILLRDRAQHHSFWPGDVVHLCGPSFNWAQVLPLLEGVKASKRFALMLPLCGHRGVMARFI